MTVALISLQAPQSVVATFPNAPPTLSLPNGSQVFGAIVGWVSQDGGFSLVNVTPAVIAAGQQASGPPTYSVANGVVTQTVPTQSIPAPQIALAKLQAALASGLTLTWSSSTTLNDTYPLDQTTQFNMTAEIVSILTNGVFTNGQTTRMWPDSASVQHSFTVAQFKVLATAQGAYVDAALTAQMAQAAGGNPTWPSNQVSVTG